MLADLEQAQPDREREAATDPDGPHGLVCVRLVGYPPAAREGLTALLGAEGYAVCDEDHDGADGRVEVVLVELGTGAAALASAAAATGAVTVGTASSRLPEEHMEAAYAAGLDLVLMGQLRPRELVARIRSLVRALPAAPVRRSRLGEDPARCTSITFSATAGTATVAGRTVALTAREGRVLQALLDRGGSVVTRAELLSADPDQPPSALDFVVRGVRAKLEAIEGRRRIVTVRGVGFRLLPDR